MRIQEGLPRKGAPHRTYDMTDCCSGVSRRTDEPRWFVGFLSLIPIENGVSSPSAMLLPHAAFMKNGAECCFDLFFRKIARVRGVNGPMFGL
jgi:hypothetical protein